MINWDALKQSGLAPSARAVQVPTTHPKLLTPQANCAAHLPPPTRNSKLLVTKSLHMSQFESTSFVVVVNYKSDTYRVNTGEMFPVWSTLTPGSHRHLSLFSTTIHNANMCTKDYIRDSLKFPECIYNYLRRSSYSERQKKIETTLVFNVIRLEQICKRFHPQ